MFLILGVPPPGRVCAGLVAPASPDLGAPPQVLRGVCAGLVAPASTNAGAPPCTRVTFPSRGKSPKARQGLRPLESPRVPAKLWEPDEVRFEGWNAKPIELKAITIPYRPFRARCAALRLARRATFCHKTRPICHFELSGQTGLFFSPSYTGDHTSCCQSVARWVGVPSRMLESLSSRNQYR